MLDFLHVRLDGVNTISAIMEIIDEFLHLWIKYICFHAGKSTGAVKIILKHNSTSFLAKKALRKVNYYAYFLILQTSKNCSKMKFIKKKTS